MLLFWWGIQSITSSLVMYLLDTRQQLEAFQTNLHALFNKSRLNSSIWLATTKDGRRNFSSEHTSRHGDRKTHNKFNGKSKKNKYRLPFIGKFFSPVVECVVKHVVVQDSEVVQLRRARQRRELRRIFNLVCEAVGR